jgi:hypothetical protein
MYVILYYESLGAKLTVLAFFMAFASSADFLTDIVVGYLSGRKIYICIYHFLLCLINYGFMDLWVLWVYGFMGFDFLILDFIRTKFGRRRPFMLLGVVFYPITIIMLFYPPELDSNQFNWWFGVCLTLFLFFHTLWYAFFLAYFCFLVLFLIWPWGWSLLGNPFIEGNCLPWKESLKM